MKYYSTRGTTSLRNFEQVFLAGLAPDGGLYVPCSVPRLEPQWWEHMAGASYPELALKIMAPFISDGISYEALKHSIERAYARFTHVAHAPLVQLDHTTWVLELFHGPTYAFKDFALCWVGALLEHVLARRQERVVIVGATSGDTGSAAIAGCAGVPGAQVVILHPKGRTSEIQRRQMTTVTAENVHNIAIEGDFDDCQAIVKQLFHQESSGEWTLPDGAKLVAVNSINWARILAQTVYYMYAGLQLGAPHRAITYAVPTGNAGDIYAGYLASLMGLPVHRLVLATNANNILHRMLACNAYARSSVLPTLSPSMDIQVASNMERILWHHYAQLYGAEEGGRQLAQVMQQERSTGSITLPESLWHMLHAQFPSASCDDASTLATMQRVLRESGYLLDPHTATGVYAVRALTQQNPRWDAGTPRVVLGTAHPAKFPDAVASAGLPMPVLPPGLSEVLDAPERYVTLPAAVGDVADFIRANV